MVSCWCVSLVVIAATVALGRAGTVLDLIRENPDLSEFLKVVETDKLMMGIMSQAEGTVFAPTNAAMAKYTAKPDYLLVKYHMVNLALSLSQLQSERTVLTYLKGSQPLFVATRRDGSIFINNARVISGDRRPQVTEGQQDQVLHIIDEVLVPTIPKQRGSKYFNPTALELLHNADKYNLGDASISKFYQKVQELEKTNVFNTRGNHTYFIPIDDSFDAVRDRINVQVLDGHVIPNHVLFTRTMGSSSYRTLAFGDMLKVTIRLRSEPLPLPHRDGTELDEVQSTTLLGDIVHPAGSVLSRMVRPNIAVKNGVVHLIQKPLMVMDSTVLKFIQEGAEDRFKSFYTLLQDNATYFIEKLMTASYVTLFIPSNEAFRNVDQQRLAHIMESREKLDSVLHLHLVRQKVTTESIRKSPQRQGLFSVDSDAPGRQLYLSVLSSDLQPALTVEGGGTNATVVVPDITLNNGIVHVIDRILGVPYQSVLERLRVDPMASSTSYLADKSGFSDSLNDKGEQFTFLLPSNVAWERLKVELREAHSKLFSQKASKQAREILERHLITKNALTMAQLAKLSVENGGIDTEGGQVQVEHIPGSTDYLVKWGAVQARVSRSDEECTDGYIHIIDSVLMEQKDVSTSSGSVFKSSLAVLPAACLTLLLRL